MQIAARTAAWAKSGGWVNPYVTDGLIAMWDGEWNAGWGVHDENTSIWKNLVAGSPDVILTGVRIDQNSVYFPGSSQKGYGTFERTIQNVRTIELVVLCHNDPTLGCIVNFASSRYGIFGIALAHSHFRPCVDNLSQLSVSCNFSELTTCSFLFDDSKCISAYDKGSEVFYSFFASLSVRTVNGINSNDPVGDWQNEFSIYSLRAYDRNLTAAEIAANYAIDKARFNLPD